MQLICFLSLTRGICVVSTLLCAGTAAAQTGDGVFLDVFNVRERLREHLVCTGARCTEVQRGSFLALTSCTLSHSIINSIDEQSTVSAGVATSFLATGHIHCSGYDGRRRCSQELNYEIEIEYT